MIESISDDAIKVQMVKNIIDLADSETPEEDRQLALNMLRKYSNLSLKYVKPNNYQEISFINFVSKITEDHELEAKTVQKISDIFATKSFSKERQKEVEAKFFEIVKNSADKYKEQYKDVPDSKKPIPDIIEIVHTHLKSGLEDAELSRDIAYHMQNIVVDSTINDSFEEFKEKDLLEQLQILDLKLRSMGVDIKKGRDEIEEILEKSENGF